MFLFHLRVSFCFVRVCLRFDILGFFLYVSLRLRCWMDCDYMGRLWFRCAYMCWVCVLLWLCLWVCRVFGAANFRLFGYCRELDTFGILFKHDVLIFGWGLAHVRDPFLAVAGYRLYFDYTCGVVAACCIVLLDWQTAGFACGVGLI